MSKCSAKNIFILKQNKNKNIPVQGCDGSDPFSPPPTLPAAAQTGPPCSQADWRPIAAEVGTPTTLAPFVGYARKHIDSTAYWGVFLNINRYTITHKNTCISIQLLSQLLILMRVAGLLESITADFGQWAVYTLNWLPANRAHIDNRPFTLAIQSDQLTYRTCFCYVVGNQSSRRKSTQARGEHTGRQGSRIEPLT